MSETIQDYQLDEQVKKIIEQLPVLIQQNPLLKYAVWDICADKFADKKKTEDRFELLLEEFRKERERSDKRFAELKEEIRREREKSDKRFEKFDQRFEKFEEWMKESEQRLEKLEDWMEESKRRFEKFEQRCEKFDQRFEEMHKEITLLAEKIARVDKRIDRTIGALGARWGLNSEKAFRDAIRDILRELTNYKVERFLEYDMQGIVFDEPDQIELDVVIKNNQTWLIEIKSSVSKADVYIFKRKVEFYEQDKGVKASKKIIISPMVDRKAVDLAQKLGIKIYNQPEDIEDY